MQYKPLSAGQLLLTHTRQAKSARDRCQHGIKGILCIFIQTFETRGTLLSSYFFSICMNGHTNSFWQVVPKFLCVLMGSLHGLVLTSPLKMLLANFILLCAASCGWITESPNHSDPKGPETLSPRTSPAGLQELFVCVCVCTWTLDGMKAESKELVRERNLDKEIKEKKKSVFVFYKRVWNCFFSIPIRSLLTLWRRPEMHSM